MNTPDAIVVGAGQAGLAATRCLLAPGLQPVVLEAGPEQVDALPAEAVTAHAELRVLLETSP